MINNINKYKIKNFKFLNYFKNKELIYNLICSIKKDKLKYNFIIQNYILIFFYKKINYFFIKKSNLKLRCILNENTHSIHYFFSLNRISLRKFFSYGLINGFYKSSW